MECSALPPSLPYMFGVHIRKRIAKYVPPNMFPADSKSHPPLSFVECISRRASHPEFDELQFPPHQYCTIHTYNYRN